MTATKNIKKIFKYVIGFMAAVIGLAGLFFISSQLYTKYKTHRESEKIRQQTEINSPDGIESIEMVTIGGIEQCISIRGWDVENPILLYLHGGPGADGILLARYFDSELEKKFIVARWSQRGAGRSYSPDIPPETMSMDQLISDAAEVAKILIKRFNKDKIYLVGHSWGGALGARVAALKPELFHAFIGVAPLVHGEMNEEASYQFTVDRAKALKNSSAIDELQKIGEPPWDNLDKLFIQRKWLRNFRGINHQDLPNLWHMSGISPDAAKDDGRRYRDGEMFSLKHMWTDFEQVDLFNQANRIDVPVYFFLGRHDFNTPTHLAVKFFDQLEAPRGKQIIWFENCAHVIPFEAPDKYAAILINKVFKETHTSN